MLDELASRDCRSVNAAWACWHLNPSGPVGVLPPFDRKPWMLTDGQWAVLEPLIETCRPPAKVAPQTLRQTMGAILWRRQNGAKWQAVLEVMGPWWKAAQTFIR